MHAAGDSEELGRNEKNMGNRFKSIAYFKAASAIKKYPAVITSVTHPAAPSVQSLALQSTMWRCLGRRGFGAAWRWQEDSQQDRWYEMHAWLHAVFCSFAGERLCTHVF